MSRILAVVLLPALVSVSLFAANCQPPPATNCTALAPCSISVKWFKDNQHCTEPAVHDSEIMVLQGGILKVTANGTVGDFKVLKFKKHSGNPCNWKGAHTLATPFSDNHLNAFSSSHDLTAQAGSDGCYTVNFELNDHNHTKIDPHIIVSGNGNVPPPIAIPSPTSQPPK